MLSSHFLAYACMVGQALGGSTYRSISPNATTINNNSQHLKTMHSKALTYNEGDLAVRNAREELVRSQTTAAGQAQVKHSTDGLAQVFTSDRQDLSEVSFTLWTLTLTADESRTTGMSTTHAPGLTSGVFTLITRTAVYTTWGPLQPPSSTTDTTQSSEDGTLTSLSAAWLSSSSNLAIASTIPTKTTSTTTASTSTIPASTVSTSTEGGSSTPLLQPSKPSLSTNATVGIIVGAIFFCFVILISAMMYRRFVKHNRRASSEPALDQRLIGFPYPTPLLSRSLSNPLRDIRLNPQLTRRRSFTMSTRLKRNKSANQNNGHAAINSGQQRVFCTEAPQEERPCLPRESYAPEAGHDGSHGSRDTIGEILSAYSSGSEYSQDAPNNISRGYTVGPYP
ncbi:hypothetical protein BGZ63DRAFT_401759 [Mariannaea sp. PMI_226]|nr:hypothetical protein BGZ63DRAFT_401759 [Mariannaea sp. PMI_226]